MRKINKIVIHCSATREGQSFTVADIDGWHRARGFAKIGYHFIIDLNGNVFKGRDISEIGAHVQGHNSDSIGICYIGGLDRNGNPKDTRTPEQIKAMHALVFGLKAFLPDAKILGHRDLSPDKNGNGIIESWEWLKACPCFDTQKEFAI